MNSTLALSLLLFECLTKSAEWSSSLSVDQENKAIIKISQYTGRSSPPENLECQGEFNLIRLKKNIKSSQMIGQIHIKSCVPGMDAIQKKSILPLWTIDWFQNQKDAIARVQWLSDQQPSRCKWTGKPIELWK